MNRDRLFRRRASHPRLLVPSVVLVAGLLVSGLLIPELSLGQTPPSPAATGTATEPVAPDSGTYPPPTAPPPSLPAGLYLGATSCAGSNCHAATRPSREFDVLLTEYHQWSRNDPHARAYEVLATETSRLIARNLGLASAESASQCLGCHAMAPPKAKQARPLDLVDEGISCEACHGPASGWRDAHVERDWTKADGVRQGFLDLANVQVRTRLCLSCHVGSGETDVDHRLIAAGHPVLRFELDNFSQVERVRHWRARGGTARDWAVGQAAALTASLRQLVHRAQTGPWPEFAEMSCQSCHHPIGQEHWRQPRNAPGGIGDPPWSPARWAVLRLLAAEFARDELAKLEPHIDALATAVAKLQSAEQVLAVAGPAVQAAELVQTRLERVRWSETTTRRLLDAVLAAPADIVAADQAAAEQTAWALQALISDQGFRQPSTLTDEVRQALDALFIEAQRREQFDRRAFLERLDAVSKVVPGRRE